MGENILSHATFANLKLKYGVSHFFNFSFEFCNFSTSKNIRVLFFQKIKKTENRTWKKMDKEIVWEQKNQKILINRHNRKSKIIRIFSNNR